MARAVAAVATSVSRLGASQRCERSLGKFHTPYPLANSRLKGVPAFRVIHRVLVARLRKKALTTLGEELPVKTVHQLGYTFSAPCVLARP